MSVWDFIVPILIILTVYFNDGLRKKALDIFEKFTNWVEKGEL